MNGDGMITIKEVAEKAGVSSMTVTRVINNSGYVSQKTREKIESVIKETGYIPNRLASTLFNGVNRTIAILVPNLSNPYYLQVVDVMVKYASRSGIFISIVKSSEENVSTILENLISIRVMGILNYSTHFPEKYIDILRQLGIKYIYAGHGKDLFCMTVNYEDAMKIALDKMRNNGLRYFYFISGISGEMLENDTRVRYFDRYLKTYDMPVCEDTVMYGNYPKDESYVIGYTKMSELIGKGRKTDVVMCLNDMMAFGAITAAQKKGKRIPEDIKVIGFDNILISGMLNPSISTISLNIEKEGSKYMEYLTGNKETYISEITADFIERESTGIV